MTGELLLMGEYTINLPGPGMHYRMKSNLGSLTPLYGFTLHNDVFYVDRLNCDEAPEQPTSR
jgi:hypothetical protein